MPPQPYAVDTACYAVCNFTIKIIDRGDEQEVRIDFLLRLVNFADIISRKGVVADANIEIIDIETMEIFIFKRKPGELF